MATISVPTRSEVSENNQHIFDNLQKNLGFVPNLYATFAYSDTALADYLQLQNRKSSLKA
ncbi:MAG: carboxymuconolactone decarboxylase family protein, partial [Bacteroidota bacterium]